MNNRPAPAPAADPIAIAEDDRDRALDLAEDAIGLADVILRTVPPPLAQQWQWPQGLRALRRQLHELQEETPDA